MKNNIAFSVSMGDRLLNNKESNVDDHVKSQRGLRPKAKNTARQQDPIGSFIDVLARLIAQQHLAASRRESKSASDGAAGEAN
jgi:hypothetical protein